LVASERREKKEKLRREIKKLQKQLDELEEAGDTSEVEPERNVASGPQHEPVYRFRTNPPSDEATRERHRRWPIARARRVDPTQVSPQRYVHCGRLARS